MIKTALEETMARDPAVAGVTRSEIEDFLFHEAALLDEWRLDEWLTLLTGDATYEIPTTNCPTGDSRTDLFFVADDRKRLEARVRQLMGRNAWIEYPHSRTRRLVTNVRITKIEGGDIHIAANIVAYRIRNGEVAPYIARYEHIMVHDDGRLKIRKRKTILDIESLKEHGSIAFIL